MQQTTLTDDDNQPLEYSYAHHDIPREDVTLLKEPEQDGCSVYSGVAVVTWGSGVYLAEVHPEGELPFLVPVGEVDTEKIVDAVTVHQQRVESDG